MRRRLTPVSEEQADRLAARRWGLTDKEMKEIKMALEELR
jgi:5-bromo-4-chloroindolyl phosphate hydrolysis protein